MFSRIHFMQRKIQAHHLILHLLVGMNLLHLIVILASHFGLTKRDDVNVLLVQLMFRGDEALCRSLLVRILHDSRPSVQGIVGQVLARFPFQLRLYLIHRYRLIDKDISL